MPETSKMTDGLLEITKTGDSVITTMTKEEVVGKIAEVQTKIDHLNIDLAEAGVEKAKWDNYLEDFE